MLTAERVSVMRDGRTVVHEVSFHLAENSWLMLLGPNGAGKTTLAEAVSGALPFTGRVTICGRELQSLRAAELAKYVSVVSQTVPANVLFTAEEIVAMGRNVRRGLFSAPEKDMDERVSAALEAVGLTYLRKRRMAALSGGEQQLVYLAQAFCQDPAVLILDEPDSHLDLAHTQALFRLADEWRRKPGRAVLSVEHDLRAARRYADEVLLLKDGSPAAWGHPDTVMTAETLAGIWQADVAGWLNSMNGEWR